MNKAEVLSYIEEKTGFKRAEWGGCSIGYTTVDAVSLHVLRVGKKVKGQIYTKTITNFTEEEAIEFAHIIRAQLISNQSKAGSTVSRAELFKAKRTARALEEKIVAEPKEEEEYEDFVD